MQCDVCGNKKATVHLTEIVDEQMTELHLCEDCARQKSVQMEQQFGLADLLAGLADFGQQVKNVEKIKLQCSNCSMTYDDFRKVGRLGCSGCYVTFKRSLGVLLKRIHGSHMHLGKSPARSVKPTKAKNELADLKRKLELAIVREEFEEAAKLRDQMRRMEQDQSRQKTKG